MSPEGEEKRGRKGIPSREGSQKGRLGLKDNSYLLRWLTEGAFKPAYFPTMPTLMTSVICRVYFDHISVQQPARLQAPGSNLRRALEPAKSGSPVYSSSPPFCKESWSLCVTSHLRELYDRTTSPNLARAVCRLPHDDFKPPQVRGSTFAGISVVPFNAIDTT